MAAGLPQVRQALSDDPLCDTLFRRLDRAAHWTRGRLSADRVAALYGEKVAMSASRMDQYQSCHFAYFLRYGLGAKDRRPAGFHAPSTEPLSISCWKPCCGRSGPGGVARVSQEAVQACTARAVEAMWSGNWGMEHQTPRFRYLFRRLERNVRAVVDNVVAELQASDFQPVLFELGFGPGKELPPVEITEGGVTLRISGFVDRVDGWVKDGRLYLRVVDYKTGRKSS